MYPSTDSKNGVLHYLPQLLEKLGAQHMCYLALIRTLGSARQAGRQAESLPYLRH